MNMKMAVFWDVAQCSLVEAYRRFRDACCLYHQDEEFIFLVPVLKHIRPLK
jgi:hypothetical protein